MRRFLYAFQVVLLGLFIFTISITLVQLLGGQTKLATLNYKQRQYNGVEEYDVSLNRLNTINKFEGYCDSLYTMKAGTTNNPSEADKEYVELVNSVVKKRFYHGYSYYGLDNNYLAYIFSKATQNGYSAVVIPDDILKYPNASCSQQSMVMMKVLQR